MEYNEIDIIEFKHLPKDGIKQFESYNHNFSCRTFETIWHRNEKGNWYAFTPIDKNFKKYVVVRALEPPMYIWKKYHESLQSIVNNIKAIKSALDGKEEQKSGSIPVGIIGH